MHASGQTPPKVFDEYKKIFCAYHKTEFLTNFCVHKSCLMPLCPSCIVDHTEDHYRQPSRPLYMNLHQALHDTKQNCLYNIRQFQQFSRKLVLYLLKKDQLSQFKKKLVESVHAQLSQHKQNIYLHIERLFMNFQHQVYNVVVADYDQEGLYKQDDINEYAYKIQDTINELYDKIGAIKGDQCLASLIMYFGEERERITAVREECQRFISRHQHSKIDTILDQAAMKKQLQNIFQNIVEIKKVTQTTNHASISRSRKYEPIQRKTPQKNKSMSQSRRSRIFNEQDSKKLSPPKQNLQVSNKKQGNLRYESSFH